MMAAVLSSDGGRPSNNGDDSNSLEEAADAGMATCDGTVFCYPRTGSFKYNSASMIVVVELRCRAAESTLSYVDIDISGRYYFIIYIYTGVYIYSLHGSSKRISKTQPARSDSNRISISIMPFHF